MQRPTKSFCFFEKSIPVGFLTYPISQAADITAFKADLVPVGVDQLPMLEQTNEIVDSFNRIYGETLVRCQPMLADNKKAQRLPGLDGKSKMSKSLNNGIYLCDPTEEVKKILLKHYQGKKGNVTAKEILNMFDVMRTGNKNFNQGNYVYTKKYTRKGNVYFIVIKLFANKKEAILKSFYSNDGYK